MKVMCLDTDRKLMHAINLFVLCWMQRDFDALEINSTRCLLNCECVSQDFRTPSRGVGFGF